MNINAVKFLQFQQTWKTNHIRISTRKEEQFLFAQFTVCVIDIVHAPATVAGGLRNITDFNKAISKAVPLLVVHCTAFIIFFNNKR